MKRGFPQLALAAIISLTHSFTLFPPPLSVKSLIRCACLFNKNKLENNEKSCAHTKLRFKQSI